MNIVKVKRVSAVLALTGVLAGTSAVAVGLWRWHAAAAPAAPTSTASAPAGSAQERVEVLRVTLRPTGFDPAVLTASKGRVLIALDDLSGLDDVTLRLDRAAGGRLREGKAGRGSAKWREVIDLRPGQYVLGVAGRPDWACRVTVAAD